MHYSKPAALTWLDVTFGANLTCEWWCLPTCRWTYIAVCIHTWCKSSPQSLMWWKLVKRKRHLFPKPRVNVVEGRLVWSPTIEMRIHHTSSLITRWICVRTQCAHTQNIMWLWERERWTRHSLTPSLIMECLPVSLSTRWECIPWDVARDRWRSSMKNAHTHAHAWAWTCAHAPQDTLPTSKQHPTLNLVSNNKFPPCFRVDWTMCIPCWHGTLFHFGLQHDSWRLLNNCYYHQDLHWRLLHLGLPLGFYANLHALLHHQDDNK